MAVTIPEPDLNNEWRRRTPGAEGWNRSARPDAADKFFMVSADGHVQEPRSIFKKRIPEEYHDRLPSVVVSRDKKTQFQKTEGFRKAKLNWVDPLQGHEKLRYESGRRPEERAAELAITEFQEAGQHLSEGDLVEVVLQANRQVHGHAADNGLPGMGTTVVAMTLHDDNTITVANVGDSRAYWLRGDYMGQVTEDHSFVEDLVRQGRLTAEEAATHPQRNILTRAVGIGAEVEVDRFPIPEPEVGDRFLLCSDGLFNELSEDEILDIQPALGPRPGCHDGGRGWRRCAHQVNPLLRATMAT